jgi:hypothetical protein
MIDATVTPKVGFISPFGTIVCNVNHISAEFYPEDIQREGVVRSRVAAMPLVSIRGENCSAGYLQGVCKVLL